MDPIMAADSTCTEPPPAPVQQPTKKKSSGPAADERRKGVPWSEEEHRLFLQVCKQFIPHPWVVHARFAYCCRAVSVLP